MGEEFKPGTEAFRSVKDQINQEGWQRDDDGEGQAAVFIGTKEEAEVARQRLESKEATFADLRSYLAVNSYILAGPDEMRALFGNKWSELKPGTSFSGGENDVRIILYKSKDGELKKCKIDLNRIAEFAILSNLGKQLPALSKSLVELGFVKSYQNLFSNIEWRLREKRESDLQKEKAVKEFEF